MSDAPDKVLVMELAGLGDNVHLLPALWSIRRRWPQAELHVMVNAPAAGLFRMTPWVDKVWSYPTAPKPRLAGNLAIARELRQERFDCLINTNGSDRSSWLSWATRAPRRIGRRPADGGPIFWRHLFTEVVEHPYYQDLMYVQKWRMLAQAGFEAQAGEEPQFQVRIDPAWRREAGIAEQDEGRYLHVSPFTALDRKELAPAQLAELIAALRKTYPAHRIVVSCAGSERELVKMATLLPLLREPPWRVYAGTLDVGSLTAVIEKAALSLSGDSAALHLAMMTRTPAVAWYRAHGGQKEWIPSDPRYRAVVAESDSPDALRGIPTSVLLDAAREALASATP